MDIYYFYNGINNIIKLALKDKKYVANYKLILNDPLVILDFEDSSNLKGGAHLIAAKVVTKVASDTKAQKLATDAISKGKDAAKDAVEKGKDGAKGNNNKEKTGDNKEKTGDNKKDGEPNPTTIASNNKEEEELSPKEQALKILKILFSFVYYLCLFSILPLLPFIAISYYSFKRLTIFYNEQMGTL
jgi:hypothetical protein